MKLTRSLVRDGVVLLAVLAFILWYFFFSGRVFHSRASNAPNRDALVLLHEAIQIGTSASEVRDLFQRYATPQLRLHDERPTDWVVRMPMEFGASDWKLLLDFRDDRVVRVRLVTADGPPPKNGPPDKQKPDAEPSGEATDAAGRPQPFCIAFGLVRLHFSAKGHTMTTLQRFLVSIVPETWARSMEKESRLWMIRCSCGHERSVWDAGGIRWKAFGNPRRYLYCPRCGQSGWHQFFKRDSSRV